MENENFLEKLASQFSQNASVKNVYGEPVHAGDKTIIPVARIAYGLGGGYGQGYKKTKRIQPNADLKQSERPAGEGGGGGGGMYAKPHGVYEVTAGGTKFIPATNTKQLLMGVAVGFILRGWFYSKRRNKKNSGKTD
jgi:uncharacterized spore protein YtfJ